MATKLIAFDAKTRTITAELPYKNFSYTSVLNGKGSWTASLPMSHESQGVELLTDGALGVGRTQVAFVRDGVPLFGGFMLQESDEITEESESFTIGGPDATMGPLEKVQLWSNYKPTADQFAIVATLVQGYPMTFQEFGITVVYDALSGVTKSRTWYSADREIVAKLIDDMAGTQDGFDYLGELTGDQSAGFRPKLRLGYPDLRRETAIVVELGKNIKTLKRGVDGSKLANFYTVKGQKTGEIGVVAYAFNAAAFPVYPEMDGAESRPTNSDSASLLTYAQQGAKLYGLPQPVYTVEVDPNDTDCRPGSFRLGDEIRLIAKRGRVDVDATYRVMSYSLSGDVGGNEKMTMTLVPQESAS